MEARGVTCQLSQDAHLKTKQVFMFVIKVLSKVYHAESPRWTHWRYLYRYWSRRKNEECILSRCTGMRKIMLCIIKDVGPLHLIKSWDFSGNITGFAQKWQLLRRIMSPICVKPRKFSMPKLGACQYIYHPVKWQLATNRESWLKVGSVKCWNMKPTP